MEPRSGTPEPASTMSGRVLDQGGATYKRFIRAMPISGHSRNGEFMEYTRFEKARIIGARALQISLGAPVVIDIPEGMIDPIKIAIIEFEDGLIPITVNREA